jgi:DNA-binding response OmpR family regulator
MPVPPLAQQLRKNYMAKVMIVDDDLTTVRLLQTLLELDGFQIASAGSGADAVRIIAEFQPDIVLMDYHLIDMYGTDVVRMLREQGYTMPIIVASGMDVKKEALEAGADRFLVKPFEPDQLPAIFHELIG